MRRPARLRLLAPSLLLAACAGSGNLPPGGGSGDDDDATEPTPEPTPDPCLDLAPLPVDWAHHDGFTGSEDFALDGQGRMVSVDWSGNLVAIDMEGDIDVLIPGLGETAGIDFLPDGDIAWNDVATGSLVRANLETGAERVLLSGLEYPNGLDVDDEGFLYVAEQSGGRVRRVDSETGEFEIIAEGLYAPNGVSFGPDFDTLYVNSFGGGTVWAMDRDGATFSDARVYATMPGAQPPDPEGACEGAWPGDACMDPWTWALGQCEDEGSGELSCVMRRDVAACVGLEAGDPCETRLGADALTSRCAPNPDGGLFCPRAGAEYVRACEGRAQDEACEVLGEAATCYPSFESAMVCWPWDADGSAYTDACIDHELGDACVVADPAYPSVGTCVDGAEWGWGGDVCLSDSSIPGNGGALDGINVDLCGNLYVTEYVAGIVWRFTEEGGEPELAAQLTASWIPNMHFGHGVGGWEEEVLYVIDRDTAGVFALELSVPGHGEITGRAP